MSLDTFNQRYASADSNTAGTFGFDLISGTDWAVSKLAFGALGSITHVSAADPLPVTISGVATAANQATANASLASIDGKITACNTGAVVVSSSALPSGAATAAKQPALGTAGTASADVITVQGVAGMTAVAISAASLPLPSGAATSAKQDTAQTALDAIAASLAGTLTVGTHAVTQSGTWNISTVTTVTTCSTVTALTGGSTAHDAAASSIAPHLIGAYASAAAPSDVSADNDAVRLWALRNGSLVCNLAVAGTLVTGSAGLPVAQQGTWTVTANAGTNLNTSALALESGGNLAAAATSLAAMDDWDESDRAKVNPIVGQAGVAAGAGTVSATVQRVTLASDQTTLTNTIGNVGEVPITSGGLSGYSFLSTAAVQAAEIKGSAGQVYTMEFFNHGASPVHVRLYNQTGSPANTDTANIVWRGTIPGNTAGAGFIVKFPQGRAFGTGIGIRVTAAVADNDNTALSANEVKGNVEYK